MSLDGELNRIHESQARIESKVDTIIENQTKFVTHTESNWKTGILAALSLVVSGKMAWHEILNIFIKFLQMRSEISARKCLPKA